MLRRFLFSLLLGSVACKNDQQVTALHPEIVVTPTALDFEGVVVDYSEAQEIQIFNAGRKTLEIDKIRIDGDDADAFVVGMKPAEVEPDQVGLLSIEFWPETYVEYSATAVILSNDEESAEVSVTLAGEGVPAPTPDIFLSTTVID